MHYEVLVLRNDWVFATADPSKFKILTDLINKAYHRPLEKYGIMQTPRIKDPPSFISNLQFSSSKKNFMVLLLASELKYQTIIDENSQLDPKTKRFLNRDIAKTFDDLLPSSDIKITIAEPDFHVDESIGNRILSTIAFKQIDLKKEGDYEMTAFTSFLHGIAPNFLEFVLNHFKVILDVSWSPISILAIVIREHELVDYYTKYCGFEKSNKPDIFVSATEMDCPFDDDCRASKNFHLAFLHRLVII